MRFEVAISEAEFRASRWTLLEMAEHAIKQKVPHKICGWYAYKKLEDQPVYLFLCATIDEKISDTESKLLLKQGYEVR